MARNHESGLTDQKAKANYPELTREEKKLGRKEMDRGVSLRGNPAQYISIMDDLTGHSVSRFETETEFCADLRLLEIGPLRAGLSKTSPHRAWAEQQQDNRGDHGSHWHLLLLHKGRMTIRWAGKTLSLEAPAWCVMDEDWPFQSDALTEVEFFILSVPHTELISSKDIVPRIAGKALDAKRGTGRVFFDFVTSVLREIENFNAPSKNSFFEAILLSFRASVQDLLSAQPRPATYSLMYDQIMAYIDHRISDPALTIDCIANRLHCSRRYIHNVFSRFNRDSSIKAYINRKRLQHCRDDLLRSREEPGRIADIAYRWGFNDPAYFARLFRREFGIAPREANLPALDTSTSRPGLIERPVD